MSVQAPPLLDRLRVLKNKRLELLQPLPTYVPVRCSISQLASAECYPLEDYISKRFSDVQDTSRVCSVLMLGASGSGKTTTMRRLERNYWEALDLHDISSKRQILPILLDLRVVALAAAETTDTAIATRLPENTCMNLRQLAMDRLDGVLSEADLEELEKHGIHPLWMFDGYDQMGVVQPIGHILEECRLAIVSCRDSFAYDVLEERISRYLQPYCNPFALSYDVLYLRGFDRQGIREYLRQAFDFDEKLRGQGTVSGFMKFLQAVPSMRDWSTNPLMLSMLVPQVSFWASARFPQLKATLWASGDVDEKDGMSSPLPDCRVLTTHIVRTFWRHHYYTRAPKCSESSLQSSMEASFADACEEFCKVLALYMYENNTFVVSLAQEPLMSRLADSMGSFDSHWRDFILRAVPIETVKDSYYSFLNRLLWECYLALNSMLPEVKEANGLPTSDYGSKTSGNHLSNDVSRLVQTLGIRLMTQDRDLLQRHAELIVDSVYTQQLFTDVILGTRTRLTSASEDKKLVIAASNAISTLNYGGLSQLLPFRFDHVQDWSHIRVPNANLNYAQILNCSFSHSDLSNSSLVRAILYGSNFQGSNLTGVYTGEIGPVLGNGEKPKELRFTPNGKYLVSRASDKYIHIWDVESGTSVTTLSYESVSESMAISVNGKLLAVGFSSPGIRVWDIDSRTELAHLEGHDAQVCCLDFSPDGSLLASGSIDRSIKVWDIASCQCPSTFPLNTRVVSVCFSPDGSLLAASSEELCIHLWNLELKKCVANLTGALQGARFLAFSPTGHLLAAVSQDSASVWDLETRDFTVIQTDASDLAFVRFSPDGRLFGSGCHGSLRLWDAESCQCIASLDVSGRVLGDVWFGGDGKLIAAGWDEKRIYIWDARFSPCGPTLKGSVSAAAAAAAFRADGQLVAVGSEDGTITVWSVEPRGCIAVLNKHTDVVSHVCFTANGERLASGCRDCTIQLWNAESWESIATLDTFKAPVLGLCFSPDDKLLASGSNDRILLWTVEPPVCLAVIEGHAGAVLDLAFSPDGRWLASSCQNRSVRIWDVRSHTCEAILLPHMAWALRVTFSSDGKRLAASTCHYVHLWDVGSKQIIARFLSGKALNCCLKFSPDGSLLAVGSEDGAVRLWHGESQDPIATLTGHIARVVDLGFSHDGKFLVSASADSSARVWRFDGTSWILHTVLSPSCPLEISNTCFDNAILNTNMLALCGRSAE